MHFYISGSLAYFFSTEFPRPSYNKYGSRIHEKKTWCLTTQLTYSIIFPTLVDINMEAELNNKKYLTPANLPNQSSRPTSKKKGGGRVIVRHVYFNISGSLAYLSTISSHLSRVFFFLINSASILIITLAGRLS